MLEVYKTNVRTKTQSKKVLRYLQARFTKAVVNFDLSDRDKILRVNGITASDTMEIADHLKQLGHTCEVLLD